MLEQLPGANGVTAKFRCSVCQEIITREIALASDAHHCGGITNKPKRRRPIRLEYKKIHLDAQLPIRSRPSDAGYDVATIESAIIRPREIVNFPTGLIVATPFPYYYSVDGRSSLWSKGIVPLRGVIDSGYTGELCVALMNISSEPYQVQKGDRIAQLVLHEIRAVDFTEVTEFSKLYNIRGTAGFGSSGR